MNNSINCANEDKNVNENEYVSYNVAKVYSIVAKALMFFVFGQVVGIYTINTILMYTCSILVFVVLFAFVYKYNELLDSHKQWLLNIMAIMIGICCSIVTYDAFTTNSLIIPLATCSTFIIFLTFTALAKYIKDENTVVISGFLFSCLFANVLIGFSLTFIKSSNGLPIESYILYLFVGILTFCGYISYDTKIMYMKFKNKDRNHDHYMHALEIFLDLINIFVKLVRLLTIITKKKNNSKKE